jgi:hypothetical protein
MPQKMVAQEEINLNPQPFEYLWKNSYIKRRTSFSACPSILQK